MSTHSLTPTDRWGALATNADWGRTYLGRLVLLLAGYALLGKGFAQLRNGLFHRPAYR